jgi:hypothetical protein
VKLKVMFAVVMGLLGAVMYPMAPMVRSTVTSLQVTEIAASGARLQVASGARTQPAPTPTPAPPPAVNCGLIVPDDPLSARGLATPWQLTSAGQGPCHESNPNQAAFVEGAVLEPSTGKVFAYNPLVVDRGTRPAIAPTRPDLPDGAVVGIWIGYNGGALTLRGSGREECITGVAGSPFGQNAFCNAAEFFEAANQAIRSGKLAVPALGTAKDGKPCPTTRDFSVVDQDQSDNTTTTYLVTSKGRTAQDTPANAARLKDATVAKNGSDEGLLDRAVDKALGCTPWTVPNLADPTGKQRSTSWPLNELMAATRQAQPIALVPAADPFALVGTAPSLSKLNEFRSGVDQPRVPSLAQADTKSYCASLLKTGLPRISADRALTTPVASPAPDVASNLFNFLAVRFSQAFSNGDGFLKCEQLLGVQNPVTVVMTDGVVTSATINLKPGPAGVPLRAKDTKNR